ncbi:MAG: hypothetical protein RL003_1535, partial [Bacteroidota bacterium]
MKGVLFNFIMRVFLLTFGLLLTSWASAQVIIQGKVVDVVSRKPLSGAKVQIDKQESTAITSPEGTF